MQISHEEIFYTVSESMLFDSAWYLSAYKDVLTSGLDPAEHFLRYGAILQRDPSPFFCTTTYLQMYPDVLKAGINPLYHYLIYGAAEGREVFPSSIDQTSTNPSYRGKSSLPRQKKLSINDADAYIVGALESINDGDVLFCEYIKIKGWIDVSISGFSHLIITANKAEHTIVPDITRAEIVLKYDNFSIQGYDCHIPIPDGNPKINISIKICLKDKTTIDWKQIQVWINSEPTPNHCVLKGYADLSWKKGRYVISGEFLTTLKKSSYISVYQNGNNICNISQQAIPYVTNFFEKEIDNYDPLSMCHLFYVTDGKEYFWMSIAAEQHCTNTSVKIIHPENGSCINKNSIDITGSAESDYVTVTVNGAKKIRLKTEENKFSTTLLVNENTNKTIVEVLDSQGNYTKSIFWIHPTEIPAARSSVFSTLVESGISSPIKKDGDQIGKVLLLRKSPSPTDEIYVCNPLEKMAAAQKIQFEIIDTENSRFGKDAIELTLMRSSYIIVSRYISPLWLSAISRLKNQLGPIIYLMDDDLLAAEETESLPEKYRKKMSLIALGEFRSMYDICDKFIVTSQYLYDKYQSRKIILMHPECIFLPEKVTQYSHNGEIIISYHGTDSHKDDLEMVSTALRFIHDKFSNVLIRLIMINDHIPPILRGLQRIDIIKPMPWSNYKQYRERISEHICLAPLLNTPYNKAKSNIKFHDACSVGAVGIYTNSDAYSNIVKHNHNGLLIDNDPIAWKNALIWLLKNPDKAVKMAENARVDTLGLARKNKSVEAWEEIFNNN